MAKLKIDIVNENLNFYFANQCADIGDLEKSKIPYTWLAKMFRANGRFNVTADKLPGLVKLYILAKAINKKIYIVIDDENGVGIDDFLLLKKAEKTTFAQDAEALQINASFILGNKELIDGISYLNNLSNSSIYNYLTKSKNTAPSQISDWRLRMNYISKVISHYEGRKKKFLVENGITMQEWYILTYLCDGKDYPFKTLYHDVYKNGIAVSIPKMLTGLTQLRNKGYAEKVGVNKGSVVRITPLGRELAEKIIHKYFVNW
jgi:hypothetical protein